MIRRRGNRPPLHRGLDDYAAQVCTRTTDASDIEFARFLEAADDFAVARGDLAAEANSVADWALASRGDMAGGGGLVRDRRGPAGARQLPSLPRRYPLEDGARSRAPRRGGTGDRPTHPAPGSWANAPWAMTLLEPLPFIAASQSVRGPALAAFLVQPCEPAADLRFGGGALFGRWPLLLRGADLLAA